MFLKNKNIQGLEDVSSLDIVNMYCVLTNFIPIVIK